MANRLGGALMQARATGIRDVAEGAGFSVTTVSHVLNDVPGKRISESTRRRIQEVADRLGYRPNRLAQGLRSQRTHTIGFVSDNVVTTPFAGQMILGAQHAAADAGSILMLLSSDGNTELEDVEVRALIDRQVDGIVYASMFHRVLTPPSRLRSTRAVLLDARTENGEFSSVVPDEVGGARSAVEELLACGHRRIGFLTDSADVPATRGRLIGYRQALEVYGIAFDPALVQTTTGDSVGGFAAAYAQLTRPDRPTGLFCYNDRMAFGAYQAAADLRLLVPHDVSIVGFDDQEILSASLRPGLTTMALPHYDMGQWAVKTLLEKINTDGDVTVVHQLLPCPLVRRASVSSPPRF